MQPAEYSIYSDWLFHTLGLPNPVCLNLHLSKHLIVPKSNGYMQHFKGVVQSLQKYLSLDGELILPSLFPFASNHQPCPSPA